MKGRTVIIVLAVVVVVAAAIYYGVKQPQPASNTGTPSGGGPAALSAEERAVLRFPEPNATAAEFQAHFDLASRLAETASELDVTHCVINPLVLQTELGSNITVRNSGISDVDLEIRGRTYVVPAEGTLSLRASFGQEGGGLYGYACNVEDPSEPDLPSTGSGLIMLIAE